MNVSFLRQFGKLSSMAIPYVLVGRINAQERSFRPTTSIAIIGSISLLTEFGLIHRQRSDIYTFLQRLPRRESCKSGRLAAFVHIACEASYRQATTKPTNQRRNRKYDIAAANQARSTRSEITKNDIERSAAPNQQKIPSRSHQIQNPTSIPPSSQTLRTQKQVLTTTTD
jgi:hypothetical protein